MFTEIDILFSRLLKNNPIWTKLEKMTTNKQSSWGGRRENSGRPRTNKVTLWANVTPAFLAKLKEKAEEEKMKVGEYLEEHLRL